MRKKKKKIEKESTVQIIRFSNSLIIKRRVELGLSYRQLAQKTVDIDPDSKGVSQMTCQRVEQPDGKTSVDSLSFICAALGISPRSTWVQDDED